MKWSESMKSNVNFKKVYHSGKSYANTYLIMYVLKNDTDSNRIGISVSKKVGNSVVRHRITRLIRESYRLNEDMFNSGLDIVVIARAGARGKSYTEISSALMHLARMQKILKEMIKS
ncbi:MAG: ribonuclease protein component [Anaerocolumna sp.]|nr:ribonuclease protein component [Anaerocolumna sp.]